MRFLLNIELLLLPLLIFAAAALYASVGHAGASGYIAAFALMGMGAATMKPAALALNIVVAAVASYKFARADAVAWRLLAPMLLVSVPAAYVGGGITLSTQAFRLVVGAMLVWAALQTWLAARQSLRDDADVRVPPTYALLLVGGCIGLLSGLTGVGGGIFLSPVMLAMHWAATRRVSGTAAVFILANSIAGLAAMLLQGQSLPSAWPVWAASALIGGFIGAHLGSRKLHVPTIRKLLAAVLLIAGLKMLTT